MGLLIDLEEGRLVLDFIVFRGEFKKIKGVL